MNKNIKIVLITAISFLLLLTCTAYYYLYETEYSVLFDDLRGEDVSHVVDILKKENIDYKINDDGSQLMIEEGRLDDIRSDMVLNQLSNSTDVGFELFDNSDIGMTEFAQKLNHQRALQGELSKTISAFPEVKYARIHLVLPENKLFGKKDNSAKAAVSLFLNPGMTLAEEQVQGIKKLVAASVPDLNESSVIVNDQNGMVLGKKFADDAIDGSNRLELKQEVELYFINKIQPVLHHMYGSDNALVTIDIDLQLDDITLIKEGILPSGKNNSGTLVRKKESTTNNSGLFPEEKGGKTTTNKVVEVEYKFGKKIENITVKPGNIAKISVGVLLPGKSDKATKESISNIIAMAVGLDTARGDSIKVHFSGDLPSMKQLQPENVAVATNIENELIDEVVVADIHTEGVAVQSENTLDVAKPSFENELSNTEVVSDVSSVNSTSSYFAMVVLLLMVITFFVFWKRKQIQPVNVAPLSIYERQENFELISKWLTANPQYEK